MVQKTTSLKYTIFWPTFLRFEFLCVVFFRCVLETYFYLHSIWKMLCTFFDAFMKETETPYKTLPFYWNATRFCINLISHLNWMLLQSLVAILNLPVPKRNETKSAIGQIVKLKVSLFSEKKKWKIIHFIVSWWFFFVKFVVPFTDHPQDTLFVKSFSVTE